MLHLDKQNGDVSRDSANSGCGAVKDRKSSKWLLRILQNSLQLCKVGRESEMEDKQVVSAIFATANMEEWN